MESGMGLIELRDEIWNEASDEDSATKRRNRPGGLRIRAAAGIGSIPIKTSWEGGRERQIGGWIQGGGDCTTRSASGSLQPFAVRARADPAVFEILHRAHHAAT